MGTYLGASEKLIFNEDFIEVANNSKILFSESMRSQLSNAVFDVPS